MNPAWIKLAEKGVDFGMEVTKIVSDMQNQINALTKEQLETHKIKISMLQNQLSLITDLAKEESLSYNQKIELLEKMDEVNKELNKVIDEIINFAEKEKETIRKKRGKGLQIGLEIATGIIPFTTLIRAIKGDKNKDN